MRAPYGRFAVWFVVTVSAFSACNGNGSPSPGSQGGEFASPITVTATLSLPPSVGEEARLTFDVSASKAYEGARIDVELPPNFEFVAAAPGMRIVTAPSSDNGQPVSHAIVRRSLAAGDPLRFQATVRAISMGPAQIRVRVTAKREGGVDAGSDDVFLTVGVTQADSHFGIDVPSVGSVTPAP